MKPIALLLLFALGAFTAGGEEKKALNIEDPFILLADSMCEASSPADPDPGSWGELGMNMENGISRVS